MSEISDYWKPELEAAHDEIRRLRSLLTAKAPATGQPVELCPFCGEDMAVRDGRLMCRGSWDGGKCKMNVRVPEREAQQPVELGGSADFAAEVWRTFSNHMLCQDAEIKNGIMAMEYALKAHGLLEREAQQPDDWPGDECFIEMILVGTKCTRDEAVDLFDDLLPYLRQPEREAVSQWQPIETAPKDGQHILAAIFNDGVGFGYYQGKTVPMQAVVHYWDAPGDEGFYTSVNEVEPQSTFKATHWRPLPQPPEQPRRG